MTARILHVLTGSSRGGTTRQLALLASGLMEEGFHVHVCVLGGKASRWLPREIAPPGDATVLSQAALPGPVAFAQLFQHVRRLCPDLVHTWDRASSHIGRAAALAAGVRHFVSWVDSIPTGAHPFQRTIERFAPRHWVRIVANCEAQRRALICGGMAEERLIVIPPAAAPPAETTEPARAALLKTLGLPESAQLIGAMGCLRPSNRFQDLIWAGDLLKVVNDDVHMVIIGDGPQRWRLTRYVRLLEGEDHVHFVTDCRDAPGLLSNLACFWSGSVDGSQSGIILEVMAAGVPVVAADVTANRELLVDGKTGLLYPVGNRAVLARRSKAFLDDPALARKLGAAGRRHALAKFNLQTMVDRYAALYRDLLARA